ncbi:MAG: polyphosphate polymerase domain-containing protein [Thermodesulfobacteriota bacterium]|nr:polyphosphate polymerase domain-containing protein [Thermodesulfobacteriota bacterium]
MRSRPQKTMSSLVERYESKFTIPEYLIEPISHFVSVYCLLDQYSKQSKDGFYRVNNLYFDSPNYLLLRKRLDRSENRFNLRVRSYGDNPELPCFFEVKQRKSNIVRKYRAPIYDEDWGKLFECPGYEPVQDENDKMASNKILFLKMAYSYNATPKVLTQYKRKAYVSDVDDYARVTFDTELRYQPEQEYTIVPDEDRMVPLDNSTLFDQECGAILELKCYATRVPLWMIDLIRYFRLRRRSFSKYLTGVSEVPGLYAAPGLVGRVPLYSPLR